MTVADLVRLPADNPNPNYVPVKIELTRFICI